MRRRWDGSLQSTNTPTYDKVGITRNDFALYRCMVIEVLYVDNPNNISKNAQNPEVLYNVIILGGVEAGQTLSYCRLASWLGGINNYSERTLTPSSKDPAAVRLSEHDGDIVYVQFIQGHDAYPTIIALGKGIKNTIAAKSSEGPRLLEEYNGLVRNINNSGEMTTTMKGGSTKNGIFTPGTSEVIKEEWTKDGVVKHTMGNVTVTFDGKSNNVSLKSGSTEVLVDGASGKISLKGSIIDLGASVSDLVTKFTALANAFATHTHLVPQAPSGTLPSQPPQAPLLTTIGSQSVKVQD